MNPQTLSLIEHCLSQIQAIRETSSRRSKNALCKKFAILLLELKSRLLSEGKEETLRAIQEHYAYKIEWVSFTPMLFQPREEKSQALRELLEALA